MLTVDHYELIRRKHLVDGMSQREVARELGHSRNTVAKAVAHPITSLAAAQALLVGYRQSRRPTSDQAEVWAEVDRKMAAMGSHSPSDAFQQVYEDRRSRLDDAVARVRLPDDCCGAAFAFGGRIAGVELFDQVRVHEGLGSGVRV